MKRGFITGLLILCTGCVSDDAKEPPSGQDMTFTLVNSAADENGSRTPGLSHENKISRLDVFFYSKSGQCLYYPQKFDVLDEGGKMIVVIPKSASAGLLGTPVDLYVLANAELPRSELQDKTLEQLQQTVQENRSTLNPDPYVQQAGFLMDGVLDTTIPSSGMGNLGTIQLRRAAAKIVVNITGTQVDGYQATEAHIRLSNYLDKTALGSDAPYYTPQGDDYKQAAYRATKLPGASTDAAGPFYSYANEWESDPARESYLTIAVKWEKDSPGGEEPRMYYYRIPFDYIPFEPGDGNKHRIRRNYIYTFTVNIKELGGLDPEDGIVLNPSFELKDWTTEEIEVKLDMWDYLFVDERYVEMHDITDRAIHYTSSKPISITVDSVFYYEYLYSGKINIKKRAPGTEFYPGFNVNTVTNNIEIYCKVPINYVPQYMDLTVSHEKGFTQKIRVVQFPRQYITSEKSPGPVGPIDKIRYPPEGGDPYSNPPQMNFNFYTITTTSLSPEDDFSLGGDPWMIYRDPAGFEYRTTKMDTEYNNTISPKFVVASQRGITQYRTYTNAIVHCLEYYESKQYPAGSWRIPTQAEMLLIARLQRDPNSALKGLFTARMSGGKWLDEWWTARNIPVPVNNQLQYSVRVAVKLDGNNQPEQEPFPPVDLLKEHLNAGGGNSPQASIRCVHDVWKDQ